MEKRLLIALLCLATVLLFVGVMPIHGEAEIYDSVIRLHVLANSDSREDQALKLTVRDEILQVTTELLAECNDRERAKRILEANQELLEETAKAAILQAGYDYSVDVQFDLERYPTRSYDQFCFPAGEYLSMRVCIGEAEGQNWWCCLFPPLCLGASTVSEDRAEESFVEVGLSPSQYKIITQSEKPVYKVRFKLLELLQGR